MAFGTNTTITNAGKAIVANRLVGSGTEPKFLGVGTGATGADRTAAAADTSLSSQSGARVGINDGTIVTVNTTNDTYRVIQTFEASGTTAIDEAGLFDASTGGNMFLSATFPVVTLLDGDTIQITAQVTFE